MNESEMHALQVATASMFVAIFFPQRIYYHLPMSITIYRFENKSHWMPSNYCSAWILVFFVQIPGPPNVTLNVNVCSSDSSAISNCIDFYFHFCRVAQLPMIQCQSALVICTHHHHRRSLKHNIHYSFSLSSADSTIQIENTGDYLCSIFGEIHRRRTDFLSNFRYQIAWNIECEYFSWKFGADFRRLESIFSEWVYHRGFFHCEYL